MLCQVENFSSERCDDSAFLAVLLNEIALNSVMVEGKDALFAPKCSRGSLVI
jgi:hypothetical protein